MRWRVDFYNSCPEAAKRDGLSTPSNVEGISPPRRSARWSSSTKIASEGREMWLISPSHVREDWSRGVHGERIRLAIVAITSSYEDPWYGRRSRGARAARARGRTTKRCAAGRRWPRCPRESRWPPMIDETGCTPTSIQRRVSSSTRFMHSRADGNFLGHVAGSPEGSRRTSSLLRRYHAAAEPRGLRTAPLPPNELDDHSWPASRFLSDQCARLC